MCIRRGTIAFPISTYSRAQYQDTKTGNASGYYVDTVGRKIMYQITEAVIYEFTMILIYTKS